MGKKKKKNKKNHNEVEVMTEEEYFGFDFIAGFTSGGVPFGITSEEADENEKEMDEGLHLRMFTLDDAEEFYNLTVESETFLKEWLGWLDNINSVEDTVKNIQARFTEVTDNKGYPKSFAIIHKGQIVGTIGYNTIDDRNRVGVIGYWIGKKYKGKGIMSQSFKAIIDYGFNVLDLNRIEVRVAVENIKSRALPERFLFHHEGIIRDAEWLYDHYVDHAVYSLLKVEWEERIN